MSRPLRINFENAFYHITSRGIEKRNIFREEKDKRQFLKYLREIKERNSIILYAYVLMDNHYHLALETPKANLSQTMHQLNTSYTVYFNRKYNRVGPLFQGRYKSIIVEKNEYLLELMRYIHLNPIRSNLVKRVEDYKWSSHRNYLEIEQEGDLVNKELILTQFSKQLKKAVKLYKEFIEEGLNESLKNPFEELKYQVILGKDMFVKKIKRLLEDVKENKEIPTLVKIKRDINPYEVINLAEEKYNVKKDQILNKKNRLRDKTIYLIWNICNITLKELGEIFGISYSAVSYAIKRGKRETEEGELNRVRNEIYSKFKT